MLVDDQGWSWWDCWVFGAWVGWLTRVYGTKYVLKLESVSVLSEKGRSRCFYLHFPGQTLDADVARWVVEHGQRHALQCVQQPNDDCRCDMKDNDGPYGPAEPGNVRQAEVEEQKTHFDGELHQCIPEFLQQKSLGVC